MGINSHLGRAVRPRPGMFLWEAPSGRTLRVWNGNHYTMFDQLLNAWDDSVERMAESWEAYARHLDGVGFPLDFFYLTSTCSPVMWDNAPNNPYPVSYTHLDVYKRQEWGWRQSSNSATDVRRGTLS